MGIVINKPSQLCLFEQAGFHGKYLSFFVVSMIFLRGFKENEDFTALN